MMPHPSQISSRLSCDQRITQGLDPIPEQIRSHCRFIRLEWDEHTTWKRTRADLHSYDWTTLGATSAAEMPAFFAGVDPEPESPPEKKLRHPMEMCSQPDCRILVVKTPAKWKPTSPRAPPPTEISFSMPRDIATNLAVMLNLRVMNDPDRLHWFCVVYGACGFSVVRVTHAHDWTPENEFSMPPLAPTPPLTNGEARYAVFNRNKEAMLLGNTQRWAVIAKPLMYSRASGDIESITQTVVTQSRLQSDD